MDSQLAKRGFTEITIAYRIYWLIVNGYEVTKQNVLDDTLPTRPGAIPSRTIPPELEKALLSSGRDDGSGTLKEVDPAYKTLTRTQIGNLING